MSTMKVSAAGFDDVISALQEKVGNAESRRTVQAALQAGAEPMRDQIVANLEAGDHVRTGLLKSAISIVKFSGTKGGGYKIKVGVIGNSAPHAHLVENGHGGPKPAPEHPFMAPAYEATRAQALEIAAQKVREALGL